MYARDDGACGDTDTDTDADADFGMIECRVGAAGPGAVRDNYRYAAVADVHHGGIGGNARSHRISQLFSGGGGVPPRT
jgi:hypothetical protein